jgi:hypothetical protein
VTGLRIDWAACLQRPLAEGSDLLLADGIFHTTAAVVFVAVMLAAPLAWWARHRYRRAVMRLMGMEQVASAPAPARGDPTPADAGPVLGPAPDRTAAADVQARMRRITRATLLAWLAFGLLGVVVAVAIGPQPWPMRLAAGGGAALLALGPVLTNLPPRWSAWSHRAGLVGGLAALLWMGLADSSPDDADTEPWWETVVIFSGLALAYALMFHRRLRGLMQPLALLLALIALTIMLPYAWLERLAGSCSQELSRLPDGAPETALSGMLVAQLGVLGLWLGLRALSGLARLIARGWLSELSLGCALCLLLIALFLTLAMVPEANSALQPAPGLALLLAPIAWALGSFAVYALALGPPPAAGPAPQLLVLRVFSHDTRRHDLLDGLQARWRYLGPVHQIGGPDMVAMNIDPYEATMFLSSQLHTLFLPGAIDTRQLQARLDTRPDHDGRYRINEVFCFNTAWRRTVEQLMQLSDAIVLDLRGLTDQREGTSHEIGRLAALGLLDRTLALGDGDTDWDHVDALVRQHGADPQALQRLQADAAQPDRHAPDALFQRLMLAGAQP